MRMLVQNGYWVSRPPFGYAIERKENRPQLVPHPETGPVMRMVFERIASGEWSPPEAWQAIADTGHKLSESRFYEVLRDPIYAGLIDNSMSNGAVHAKGKPLVSLDIFTAAQAKLEERERIVRRVSDFPLRGVLVCPECGRRMTASVSTGRAGRAYAYYHCTTGEHRIPARRVHEAIPAMIDQLGRRIAPLVALLRAYMQIAIKDDMGDVRAVADACNAKLSALENKRQRLLDAYLASTIDRVAFAKKDVELQDQIGFQRARMAEADYDVHEAEQILLGSERILADLPAMWARMDGEQRHDLLHALFGDDGLKWTGTPADVEQSHLVRLVARFDQFRLAPPTGFEPVLPG
ncbi:MAG: recombinase zinc beta ribbon domain-containing protein [Verrucomicrobia bacterium]|nr:recombinase zinc beta ribbon domain-containing protein [Verrucomicrobiota bacterium]